MMLAYRLVRLIETHSDGLATGLLARVQSSEFTRDYCKVPATDLQERVYEIYRHLGEWLLGKSDFDIKQRYMEIGGAPRPAAGSPEPSGLGYRADQGKPVGVPEERSRARTSHRSFRRA